MRTKKQLNQPHASTSTPKFVFGQLRQTRAKSLCSPFALCDKLFGSCSHSLLVRDKVLVSQNMAHNPNSNENDPNYNNCNTNPLSDMRQLSASSFEPLQLFSLAQQASQELLAEAFAPPPMTTQNVNEESLADISPIPLSSIRASASLVGGDDLYATSTGRSQGSTSANRRPIRGRPLNEREKFLLFVKILFRYLDRTDNPRLTQKAKQVVAECTRRNRMGDLDYTPLQPAVEARLRGTIGVEHWRRAKKYCDYYCQMNGLSLHHQVHSMAAV